MYVRDVFVSFLSYKLKMCVVQFNNPTTYRYVHTLDLQVFKSRVVVCSISQENRLEAADLVKHVAAVFWRNSRYFSTTLSVLNRI